MITRNLNFSIICVLLLGSFVIALEPADLLIIILSQEEGYNAAQAKLLQSEIIKQANTLEKKPPQIILTHTLDIYGSWTIVPIIAYLNDKNIVGDWYVFCADNTAIRLTRLLYVLNSYDVNIYKNLWIGYALYDKEPTIIHHYAEHTKKFKYPNLASGFAISKYLLKSLSNKASEFVASNVDFSVDASYELSTFIYNKGKGARLTHVPEFCVVSNDNCATYPKPFYPCAKLSPYQNAYVAVKTCAKYHNDRLPIIRNTWAKYAQNIGYFTDCLDVNLQDGHVVPSTEQGHCAKTYAILQYAAPILQEKNLGWLIITDDDTILSLGRLMKLLTCYIPENTVALGERYGYRTTKIHGYDYLTGGAGLVLSTPLVEQIIKPGVCECPSANTPDDMFLFGVCLAHLGVKVTHSPLFHQVNRLQGLLIMQLAT
ncbi:beta-1,3-glucosyltransferase isoform X2 [Phymastichus coffea]|uniref:beta-1,3-glucosyltransferase isoform X2 n=1 Tax=Phymastichus coffea TaxID=108790 RepID=UPI00273C2919|nr:beta-1,3-glucosyltransferase isoform X2 [Phymastichus coffea]